jgi:cyclomaltodextrinase
METMSTPYWVQDAVFYQIFPDRFANGDPDNDPSNVQPWGSPPTTWGFQGGDLRGIIQKFDYLLDLGITAIYLNPIFEATSNHRYNTTDYFAIDRKLGTMADFKALLEVAHGNGVHIVLDGVFNHCGRGFFAFNDLLENGKHSPYADWFHVNSFPVDAYGQGDAETYQAWWDFKSLPKFNHFNPDVRAYLLSVARHWIEQGADGWRLDVPNEIEDDSFWGEFRKVVKSANPDAYIVGEIWEPDIRWVDADHFDGLMNYPVGKELVDLLGAETPNLAGFCESVEGLVQYYGLEGALSHYVPLDSHDTQRIRTALGGNDDGVRLAFLFQMFYPGAPAVYYGDEIGLEGGKDPDSRRAFDWDEDSWNTELRGFVQRLIACRKDTVSLRRGQFKRLMLDEAAGTCAFSRNLGTSSALLAMNVSSAAAELRIPMQGLGWGDGESVASALDDHSWTIDQGHLTVSLEPMQGELILSDFQS